MFRSQAQHTSYKIPDQIQREGHLLYAHTHTHPVNNITPTLQTIFHFLGTNFTSPQWEQKQWDPFSSNNSLMQTCRQISISTQYLKHSKYKFPLAYTEGIRVPVCASSTWLSSHHNKRSWKALHLSSSDMPNCYPVHSILQQNTYCCKTLKTA